MNIEYLKELLVLADTLSFTDAAKRCFISQSTLSKHISSIEEELDIKLFIRRKNGIDISGSGKQFIEAAREIVNIYDSALGQISKTKYDLSNSVVVGYLGGIFINHMNDTTERFLEENSKASLSYIEYISIRELENAIKHGDIDVAITTLNKENELLKTGKYTWVPFTDDALCAVLWSDHPLAGRDVISIHELSAESLAIVQDTSISQWAINSFLDAGIDKMMNSRLKFDSFSGMFSLIKSKQCISIAFSHLCTFSDDESLVFVPIEELLDVKCQTGMLWAKSHDSIAVRRFARCCFDTFAL